MMANYDPIDLPNVEVTENGWPKMFDPAGKVTHFFIPDHSEAIMAPEMRGALIPSPVIPQ